MVSTVCLLICYFFFEDFYIIRPTLFVSIYLNMNSCHITFSMELWKTNIRKWLLLLFQEILLNLLCCILYLVASTLLLTELTDPTPTWVYACGFAAGVIHLFDAFLAFCLPLPFYTQCSLSQDHCSKSVYDSISLCIVNALRYFCYFLILTGLFILFSGFVFLIQHIQQNKKKQWKQIIFSSIEAQTS